MKTGPSSRLKKKYYYLSLNHCQLITSFPTGILELLAPDFITCIRVLLKIKSNKFDENIFLNSLLLLKLNTIIAALLSEN